MISPLNRTTYRNITREAYGGKASNLALLFPMLSRLNRMVSPSRVSSPKTYFVGIDVFDRFAADNNIPENIKAIKQKHEISREEANESNSIEIYGKFYKYGVNNAISNFVEDLTFGGDIKNNLQEVFEYMRAKKIPLIVRSSSFREDHENTQCAGIYSSKFVEYSSDEQQYFENFMLAIKRVYASVYQTKAEEYMRQEKINDYDRMGIVVQQVVGYDRKIVEKSFEEYEGYEGICYGPDFSGVTLLDPYLPIIRTAANYGLNTTVVAGKPLIEFDFSRDTQKMETTIRTVPRILYQLVKRDSSGRNLFRASIDSNKSPKTQSTAAKNYNALQKDSKRLGGFVGDISDIFLNICGELGPSEMEWSVVEKDSRGLPRIFILQRRPSFVNGTPLVRLNKPNVASQNVIAESTNIFGHGEPNGFLLVDDRLRNPELRNHSTEFVTALCFFSDPFIFITDMKKFGYSSALCLPNLAGVIDESGQIELTQHEAKKFMNGNSKILATTDINWDLINANCFRRTEEDISKLLEGNDFRKNSRAYLYQAGFLSSQEARLHIDMLSMFGQAYLPNPKSE